MEKEWNEENNFRIGEKGGRWRVYRYVLAAVSCLGMALALCLQFYLYRSSVPEEIYLIRGQSSRFQFKLPASANIYEEVTEVSTVNMAKPFTLNSSSNSSYTMDVKLFGVVPLKKVSVTTVEATEVIPGGQPIGIYMETDGVLVLGTTAVTDENGNHANPAKNMVSKGDYIIAVNGKAVHYKSELSNYLKKNGDKEVVLTIRREGRKLKVRITPVKMKGNEEYKCGLWVRDDTQGIGTLSFETKEGRFGALGHGVSDVDTGELLENSDGRIYEAAISYIIPGSSGKPGELVGSIDYSDANWLGTIESNTSDGIYGKANERLKSEMGSKAIPVGLKQDVSEGKAYIQSYISGKAKLYAITIEKTNLSYEHSANMVVRVTDPELLSLTGGIVQGMSGSPIIQNGKMVGAVTHVFVNDPTKGYGIFMDEMLDYQ